MLLIDKQNIRNTYYSIFIAVFMASCGRSDSIFIPADDQPIRQSQNAIVIDRDNNGQNDRCVLEYFNPIWAFDSQTLVVYTRVWCYLTIWDDPIPRVLITMTDPNNPAYDETTGGCSSNNEVEVYEGMWSPNYFQLNLRASAPGLHGVSLQIEDSATGEKLGGEQILYLLSQPGVPSGYIIGPQRQNERSTDPILIWMGLLMDEFITNVTSLVPPGAQNGIIALANCALSRRRCNPEAVSLASLEIILPALEQVANERLSSSDTQTARELIRMARAGHSILAVSYYANTVRNQNPATIVTAIPRFNSVRDWERFIRRTTPWIQILRNANRFVSIVRDGRPIIHVNTTAQSADPQTCFDDSTQITGSENISFVLIGQPLADPPCAPLWDCTEWSQCVCPGTHTRTCTDLNGCEGTPPLGATTTTQSEPCDTCGNGQCNSGCEWCSTCQEDCGECRPSVFCTCVDDDRDGHYSTSCANPLCNPRDDCNPQDSSIYPGAPDSCNGGDHNCDGVGEWCEECGDGHCADRYGVESCRSCPDDCGECVTPPPTQCPDPEYPYYCNSACYGCQYGYTLCCPATGAANFCCGAGSMCLSNGSCCAPISETCNGTDDDCDGITDEGCSSWRVCGNGLCEVGEDCTWCSLDCGACPPPPPPPSPVCGNTTCESGESCESCPSDCACPPPDPTDGCLTYEICGDENDDNCNGDPWDGCQCRPTTWGARTRCIENRYYEACGRGIWRRDVDCLSYCQEIGRRSGYCFHQYDDTYCVCSNP